MSVFRPCVNGCSEFYLNGVSVIKGFLLKIFAIVFCDHSNWLINDREIGRLIFVKLS